MSARKEAAVKIEVLGLSFWGIWCNWRGCKCRKRVSMGLGWIWLFAIKGGD